MIAAVTMLLQILWSTLIAEHMHGSLAVLKRMHPDYELLTLISRCLIMLYNKMLPRLSKTERECELLKKKRAKLRRKKPRQGWR